MKLLSDATSATVRHMAAESDGYGYDISVETPSRSIHLEVKTTIRRGRLRIYLSRNEFETSTQDPTWVLTVLRLSHDLQPLAVATVDRDWLLAAVPADQTLGGRWESARLDVPPEATSSGMHPMVTSLLTSPVPILVGEPPWPG
ncbi:protein NO VEIN domain-containing protein [Sphaerisporangium siamense]